MSVPADKKNVVQMGALRRETASHNTLRDAVRHCLERFFVDLEGHKPGEIYQMVMGEVEPAMLETVMGFAQGNQTRAAEILGINRTTLRKKLRQYGLES